jgi:hypothetical protein
MSSFIFQNSTWTEQCWDLGKAHFVCDKIRQKIIVKILCCVFLFLFFYYYFLVNPEIVEKLSDRKNGEKAKERVLPCPF